ncbi:hypothetical protein PAMA_019432 [Pampus argenteus]
MKPIRVSTCLCHLHLICICKPASPIAPRLPRARTPIRQSEEFAERMGELVGSNPALPDTLPWEKQHGPITGCAAYFTHTPHVQHISCSLPDSPAGFTVEQRKRNTVRSILGRIKSNQW